MFRKHLQHAAVAALAAHLSVSGAHELGAHVHGVATLQIAIDEKTMTLNFSSPLDNLVGFEHAPRNARQKTLIKNMSDNFDRADRLFVLPASAQCSLQSVKLDSPALGQEKGSSKSQSARAHADLDGEFVFACRKIDQLHSLDVKLFDAYPNLHRLNVEVATPKKQAADTLRADEPSMSW